MAVALFAGSFDPIHLGHLAVIQRAAVIYDRVVVGVLANPEKPSGLFPPEDRVRLVSEATSHLPTVRAVTFYGLTVDLALREGATVLVRAAHKDRANELSMVATNRVLAGMPTVILPTEARTRTISSSIIRQLVASREVNAAQRLVPACVSQALADAAVV